MSYHFFTMMKINLKQAINGDSSTRKWIMKECKVRRQQVHAWEKEDKYIPLHHFIKLKKRWQNLNESHCPTFEENFLEGPSEKQLKPDSKNYYPAYQDYQLILKNQITINHLSGNPL